MKVLSLAVGLALLSSIAVACDCETSSVSAAKKQADVVFRGTITQFRDSGHGYRIAMFKVSRVWKGDVHEIFEMPAIEASSGCGGFSSRLIRGWNELLVYAYRVEPGSDYFTDICSRTTFASETTDYKQLGPGWKPKR